MKKIICFFLFITVFAVAQSQIIKAELMATGLTCSMCSNAINKQFKGMAEVDKVETNLNTNTFTIYLKAGNTLTPNTFKQKVEKAGFFIGSLVVTMPFANVQAADNSSYATSSGSYIFVDTNAQTLSGNVKVKVLDKGFVTQKEYKKLLKTLSKYPSYAAINNQSFHLKTL